MWRRGRVLQHWLCGVARKLHVLFGTQATRMMWHASYTYDREGYAWMRNLKEWHCRASGDEDIATPVHLRASADGDVCTPLSAPLDLHPLIRNSHDLRSLGAVNVPVYGKPAGLCGVVRKLHVRCGTQASRTIVRATHGCENSKNGTVVLVAMRTSPPLFIFMPVQTGTSAPLDLHPLICTP